MFAAMDASPVPPIPGRVALHWQWSRLDAMTAAEIYAVLAARQRVFNVEQRCAFLDADGLDAHAWHLIGWSNHGEPRELLAYLRVLDAGAKFAVPSIGRVLTVESVRAKGLGRVLMEEGLARTASMWPGQPIRIAAQQRLERFYASLGFAADSEAYVEDDILHVDMMRGGSAAL